MRAALFVFAATLVASASAQSWHILKDNLATVLTGIAFPTDNVGYVCGDSNGVGSLVLHTTDGGKNFTQESHDFELMYLAMAFASETHGIATGLGFGEVVTGSSATHDGLTWQASLSPHLASAFQDCGALKDGFTFFRYGTWTSIKGSHSGVSISTNGGLTFQDKEWKEWTPTRYGSFLTKDLGFLSGGQWPQDDVAATFEENERPIHRLNMHLYLVEHTITKKRRVVMRKPKYTVRDSNTFQAAVQKTTDGGDTWTTLFNHTGQYYPNGIQFITEDVGYFVVEGTNDNATDNAAFVYGTKDGGKTWTRMLEEDGGGLFGVAFWDENNGFAYGAKFEKLGFVATFWKTTDGGKTWALEKLRNHYVYHIDLVNTKRAYATAFMVDGNSGVLIYE